MSRIFNNAPSKRPPRNNFNLTHEILTSGRMGKLIPIQAQLVVPGDKFKQDVSFLMRFAPLAGAAMARMNVHFHSFYVPLRLCTPQTSRQSGWEDFIENIGSQGADVPQLPVFVVNQSNPDPFYMLPETLERNGTVGIDMFRNGSLWDYLKLPTIPQTYRECYIRHTNWPEQGISAMKFYAYQLIYDQWYRRDQIEKPLLLPMNMKRLPLNAPNYVASSGYFTLDTNDVNDLATTSYPWFEALHNLFKIRTRNYERDYFTSALPEPQFGDDVLLSNGILSFDENASIIGDLTLTAAQDGSFISVRPPTGSVLPIDIGSLKALNGAFFTDYPNAERPIFNLGVPANSGGYIEPDAIKSNELSIQNGQFTGIYAPSLSINEFRFAMQLQGVREKINRGGTRYKEIVNSIYHIDTSDSRLQRVQYLGGCKSPVQIGTVIQTSQTTEDSPLGTLAGKATGAGTSRLFKSKYKFEEHGFIFTVMSVTPRTSYYGGIPREFLLKDPIDYYVPDFDRLGENVIYNSELFADLWHNTNSIPETKMNDIFGYTPQYSYLKSSTSTVTGEFRDTLRYLHLSRDFTDTPKLSPEFIHAESEDFDRIFDFENINGTSNEHFYTEVIIHQVAKRPMSKYSIPLTLM